MARPAQDITLLEIVEAVEGEIRSDVLFEGKNANALADKLQTVTERADEIVRQHYRKVKLSDLAKG